MFQGLAGLEIVNDGLKEQPGDDHERSEGADGVEKSFPGFFGELALAGIELC